jgi:hypothetical protein
MSVDTKRDDHHLKRYYHKLGYEINSIFIITEITKYVAPGTSDNKKFREIILHEPKSYQV